MSLYTHIPHPHVKHRTAAGPVKVADQHPQGNAMTRFNTKLAISITKVVGSMWCAYVFALFDLISLPAAIRGGTSTMVSWIAQTFLQLVLLSVIMVGQNVQAEAADKRSEATFTDVEILLHELASLHAHLAAQDSLLLGTAPDPAGIPVGEAILAEDVPAAATGGAIEESTVSAPSADSGEPEAVSAADGAES